MKVSTLFLLAVLILIGFFAAINWSTFLAPTTLSLGFTVVQAPLGLVMLALLVFLTGVFLAFVVYLQTSVLFETRRHARELQANRTLADQAEASRFTELRSFLEMELKRQTAHNEASKAALLTRLDRLDLDLRTLVEQSDNTLSAYMGELEDRLERGSHTLNHGLPSETS